ncbi:MAG: FkbM family methyltransferase [Moraxellaceae bacterium]|jgi:FkbM family methyltransferase|nr:FkbM family methyltransferase [Moraxellaceae bacterium]
MTHSNSFARKVARALRNPLSIPRKLRNQLVFLYRLYVEKDEFTLAVRKWFAENGDDTRRLAYPLTSDSVVVDLGGYKGDFADAVYRKFGCQVYVFEPVKRFYDECCHRFAGNPKVRCFNYGLSDADGSFLISNEDDGSSLIKNNAAENCERVFVKGFVDEMKQLGVENIDLLKLNVEGAEFMILPHIQAAGLMPRIRHLQIQFHDFYPDAKPLRAAIREKLAETHREDWNYPFVWESWTRKE